MRLRKPLPSQAFLSCGGLGGCPGWLFDARTSVTTRSCFWTTRHCTTTLTCSCFISFVSMMRTVSISSAISPRRSTLTKVCGARSTVVLCSVREFGHTSNACCCFSPGLPRSAPLPPHRAPPRPAPPPPPRLYRTWAMSATVATGRGVRAVIVWWGCRTTMFVCPPCHAAGDTDRACLTLPTHSVTKDSEGQRWQGAVHH